MRELEISAWIRPVIPPGSGNLRVFFVSALRKDIRRVQGGRLVHCRVYGFEIGDERFQILTGHIPGKIADLVDDAAPDLRFGEYSLSL